MPLAKNAGFSPETIRFDTAPMVIQAYADAAGNGYDSKAADMAADRSSQAAEYAPGSGWDVLRGQRP
ncbi:MAG: hypothetical protein ABWZ74_10305 [Hyphomicrobiaceae bacterium]